MNHEPREIYCWPDGSYQPIPPPSTKAPGEWEEFEVLNLQTKTKRIVYRRIPEEEVK